MSSADDVARMLNLAGADSTALADVILDYFEGGAGLEEADDFG